MKKFILYIYFIYCLSYIKAQIEIDYKLLKYCYENNFDSVMYYLNKGANPNAFSEDGTPAIYYAIQSNNIKIIKAIVLNGGNVNMYAKGYTPLLLAVLYNNYEACEFLIHKGANVNAELKNNLSILHYAVKNSDYNIVDLLLSNKANINHQDENGDSPLFWIIKYKRYDLLDIFYKNNADFNLKNKKGLTPLLYAISTNNEKIVELLLKYPVNVNDCDYNNKCVCVYALQTNNKLIYQLIDSVVKCNKTIDELYYFYYSEQYSNANFYSSNYDIKYNKPIFKYFSFGSINKFLNRDYFTGLYFEISEVRYKLSLNLLYYGRLWYNRILTPDDNNNNYFQFWEKRSFLELSFSKYFPVNRVNNRLHIIKPVIGISYSRGKYRGVEKRPMSKSLFTASLIYNLRDLNLKINFFVGLSYFNAFYDVKTFPVFITAGFIYDVIINK